MQEIYTNKKITLKSGLQSGRRAASETRSKWQEDTHTLTPAGFVLVSATRIYWERETVQQMGQEKKKSWKKETAA
jgi:hypothetical protein